MVTQNRFRILYAEDDPEIADLAIASLDAAQFELDISASGGEGLRKHESDPYDIVLLDYELPDMDGLAIAEQMLTDDPRLPVVLITGKGSEELAARALSVGISEYLIKGSPDVYLQVLPRIIEKILVRLRETELMAQTRQKLIENQNRFRDFALTAADRFWESGPDFRYTYVSPPKGNLTLSAASLIGRAPWEVQGSEPSQEGLKNLKAAFEMGEPVEGVRFLWIDQDGNDVDVEISAKPVFGVQGEYLGHRGVTIDRTREKAIQLAQASLFGAIESAPHGVVLWDPDDKLVICNSEFKRIFSIHADELVPGLPFRDFFDALYDSEGVYQRAGDREEAYKLEMERRLSKDNDTREFLRKDGRWFHAVSMKLPDGNTIGFRSDITDEKLRDEQLRQAQKMESVGQLTGGVAHDFNNLLGGIRGHLELVQTDESLSDDAQRRIDRAVELTRKGAELTKRLLAFSRKQSLNPAPVDVGALVSNVFELMERTLGASISLESEVAPGLWPAFVDQGELENAILNLIINARDAMAEGGKVFVSIRNVGLEESKVTSGASLTPGDYVAITVQDTGTGIPADMLETVFEPFFTTKDIGKGSGLGLSMVHGFVVQSGGGVALESKEGVGTKLTLYLPRTKEDLAVETVQEPVQPVKESSSERIMIIEDDPEVRDIATIMLQQVGFEVIDGGDGSRAYQIADKQEAPVDLLLTDIVLPNGNNGPDLARGLIEKWDGLKILLMSGYADKDFIQVEGGLDDFPILQKPFNRRQLTDKVHELLGG
jgi:signal transduction histidine kinase/DNA-binding response OmpR family regulator